LDIAFEKNQCFNLRRELPRIPFAGSTGAEAHNDGTPDAGLKPGSSTVSPHVSGGNKAASPNSGSDVEERRLSAASAGKKDSRALAPVASDAEIFRALLKAGQRLAEIHVHYEQQPEYKLNRQARRHHQ
jgi:hypothetical protein